MKQDLVSMSENLISQLNGTNLSEDNLLILLKILEKLLDDKQSAMSQQILSLVVESNFFEKLRAYSD